MKGDALYDQTDPEKGQGHAPVEEEAGDQQGIEQDMRDGVEAQQEFVQGLVVPGRAVVAGFLAKPLDRKSVV